VITVNGHDVAQILEALDAAEQVKGRPTVIVAETVKGKGISFAEHNAAFHNGIFTEEQYRQAMAEIETRRAELGKN
jgi:transketolase